MDYTTTLEEQIRKEYVKNFETNETKKISHKVSLLFTISNNKDISISVETQEVSQETMSAINITDLHNSINKILFAEDKILTEKYIKKIVDEEFINAFDE